MSEAEQLVGRRYTPAMKPAPDVPHDNLPVGSRPRPPGTALTVYEGLDGAICDVRGCPALAQIKVHFHKPRTHREEVLKIKFGPYAGWLVFCGHHFDQHSDRFMEMELENTCRVGAWPVR